MIKIQVSDCTRGLTLQVEGRLAGVFAAELQELTSTCLEHLAQDSSFYRLQVGSSIQRASR